jgi:alanine dehydrogenase
VLIGVPKEIKDNEYRIALTPSGALALNEAGHEVMVERGAGVGSGFSDSDFKAAGARIISTAEEIYSLAEMITKVKEPLSSEYRFLRAGQIVFTFFHLAAERALFEAVLKSKITAIAYETIEEPGGKVPILEPMSEVAGKLATQVGAHCLLRQNGGRGVLLGGVTGVEKGEVLIIGAGTVGLNALEVAVGLGAKVTVVDLNQASLDKINSLYKGKVETLLSTTQNVSKAVTSCDLLVGAVHIPGARTPNIVTREMVSTMREGSVIVDVAVDQGGCVETTRPTTHAEPTFIESGVLHYGVTNMPGSVPRTSTLALTNVTLPYILKLAGLGLKGALDEESSLALGVNAYNGKVTNRAVAKSFEREFSPIEELI